MYYLLHLARDKAIIKRFKVSGNTLPLASNLVKCAAAGAGLNRNIL